jgi:acylaminoacyl-peptidase
VYALSFNQVEKWERVEDAMKNITVKLLEEVKFNKEDPIEKEIVENLPHFKKETITLENGAQGHFVWNEHPEYKGKRRPMITIIHGGPFGCGPQDMFLQMRTFFLM